MTENKTQGIYRLTAKLLIVVVITIIMVVMAGCHWQRVATAKEKLATAKFTFGESEQRGIPVIWAGTISVRKIVTTPAKNTQLIAVQAITLTEQPLPLTENNTKKIEQLSQLTLARQLAADSELAIKEGGGQSLSLSALLAIESVRREPTMEGDRALRSALSLMRPLEFRLTKDGYISLHQMTFDPGGRWMAAADTYSKSVMVWDLTTGKIIASLTHEDRVSDVAFAPDGRLMATTAGDGTARLWETGTWKQVARLEHDNDHVDGVTFDPTGTRLATRSEATVYLWDVSTAREIIRLEHENNVRDVEFSPFGKWMATAETEGSIVWIWDVETGQEVTQIKHDSHVRMMAFSPYGKWLATASGTTAQVWEVNTGRQVVQVIHRDVVNDVAFSPDTLLLATGSKDKTARLWEVATGRERMQFEHKDEVVSIDFSPDGMTLATGSGYALGESPARVWDVATGREIARMEHPKQVREVIFSFDGRKLATQDWDNDAIYVWDLFPGGPEMLHFERENSVKAVAFSADGSVLASGNSDGSLQVWDTATWQEITPAVMKHEGEIRAIAFNADGSRLASAAGDGTASVWDLATGKELLRVRHIAQYGSWVTDVIFSPDGKLLATSGRDNMARLWNIAQGVEVAHATHRDTFDAVWDVDFSSDGQRLASAGSGEVKVLVAPDWQEVAVLAHPGVNDIAFSSDGGLLASVGDDDMARVWDTKTWQEAVHMKHNDQNEVASAVAFSPDGRMLATGSGSTMTRVWDTNTWQEIARMPVGADLILFSPDEKWLLTKHDYGGTVRVWDVSTGGGEVARIGHTQHILDMALSPEGKLLATAGDWDGGQLLVTTWQPDDLIAEACLRLARNLTWTEWQQYLGNEPYAETCPGLPIPASVSSFDEMIDDLKVHFCMDDPTVAALRYESNVSLALQLNNEVFSKNLCWYGAQEGFASIVLPACEHAVKLAPNTISILDSRGVARALVGDSQGALADLKTVVAAMEGDEKSAEIVSSRKQIIEAIEQGQNIITEGCKDFAAVKPTPSAKTPTPVTTPTPTDTNPTSRSEVVVQPTGVVRSFVAEVDRVVMGHPGETVSHTLTVTNTGNVTSSYGILAMMNAHYGFGLPGLNSDPDRSDHTGSVREIGPGDSVQMPIDVSISDYLTNGEFRQISLLLRSDYTPGVSMQMVTAVAYTTSIERVGHIGLNARDVFLKGNYAYIAAGTEGLRILDVSDALSPVEVGSYQTAEGGLGQVEHVQVVGNYAYVVTNLSGIRIVDVSNPTAPAEVGAYRPGGSVQALKLVGNYAYLVWKSCLQRCTDRLRIVDISNPTAPVEVSAYGESFTSGGYDSGDRINDVAVIGNRAYLFMPDEMRVLDISNPAAPVKVDSSEQTGYAVVVWGDYAYIHDDKQVRVVDISSPELIVEVGGYNVPDAIVNVSQTGGYLYVTTEKDEVYILDLTIPSSPVQVGIYKTPGNREVGGVVAKGSYVYMAAGSAGLQIVDVADPPAPKKVGVYGAPTAVMGVAMAEGYVYAADRYNGLRVLDLATDPFAPVEVGFYHEPGTEALDVAVSGGYAYVIFGLCEKESYALACYGNLHVLDLSDPATPVEVGTYEGEWHKVEVSGDYVFVVGRNATTGDKAFHILDISNPTIPKQIASYDAVDFTLADGYLYLLSDKEARMTILDATTLKEISVYPMTEHHQDLYYSREIAVVGDYAYILENYSYATGSGAGWLVVDISDPAAPVAVNADFNYRGQNESWGEPAAATYGGYTFLAAKSSGLRVLDVADTDTPTEVDSFGAVGNIMDVVVNDEGYMYVASDLAGLYVLRYVGDSGK